MNETGPGRWVEIGSTRRQSVSTARRLAASFLPGLVAAGFLALLGRATMAVVVAVVATTVSAASLRWPPVARGLEVVVHAVAHAVGAALRTVLMTIVQMLIFAPVSLVSWLFRRDPLDRASVPGGGWDPIDDRDQTSAARRPFGAEPGFGATPTALSRALRPVPVVAGALALLVALDMALGAVWSVSDRAGADTNVSPDEQLTAATADQPWFPAYLDEMESLQYEFTPFVLSTPRDTAGTYVNIRDGRRESWTPPGSSGAPVVYFFGGSTVWGEGQRDDHTIPSEVARLAAADGHPIRVVNAGQRGDTNFAAAQRFEQVASTDSVRADLAVFLDGPDDVTVQLQGPSNQPSQYGLAQAERVVHQERRSLWERYLEVSLVNKVARRIRTIAALEPAAASPVTRAQAGGPLATTGTDSTLPGTAGDVARAGRNAATVYARGVRLAEHVAAEHGLDVVYLWAPAEASADPRSAYSIATEHLPPGVEDLSRVLDDVDEPVYLDAIHLNERGAAVVARAVYERLRPALTAAEVRSSSIDPGGN